MRLKKIALQGFKSFADKVSLKFHPGITAIVGPNGCGKSNISDGFRWVFGEQSAKSMRGGKMQDVIFSGAGSRKPLGMAEVTITLSEIGDGLPVAYEEIEITRRLFRDGESEYLINKQTVRLKDVQSLLMDSGMGKDSFSIFEQGKIDQVIQYNPIERRYIFEEAAGISRFLQRKHEAMRKLEQTEANLLRIRDIHSEVEKQIVILEKQAEKAKIYKDNKIKFESLEKALFSTKWDSYQKKRDHVVQELNSQNHHLEKASLALVEMANELKEHKRELEESEIKLHSHQEQYYKAKSEKEIQSREQKTNTERLREAAAKEAQWLRELENVRQKRSKRQEEVQSARKEEVETGQEVSRLQELVTNQREQVKKLEAELAQIRQNWQQHQEMLVRSLRLQTQVEGELKQLMAKLENYQDRKSRLHEQKVKLLDQIQQSEQQSITKKQQAEESTKELQVQKNQLKLMDQNITDLSEKIQTSQQNLYSFQQQIAEQNARRSMLTRLREEMEGFSAATKKLLKENNNSSSPIYKKVKPLYEVIAPREGSEVALSVVMKPYTQTLVVQNEEDLRAVITFAKNQNLQDFSLICLNGIENQNYDRFNLPSLLECAVEGPLSSHFLNGIYVAQDLDSAIQIRNSNKVALWSDPGLYIDQKGIFFFTSRGENNAFLREAELKTLEKKLQELQVQLKTSEEELKVLKQQREEMQQQRKLLDNEIRKQEMKLVESNYELQRLQNDQKKMRDELAFHEKEASQIDQKVNELKAQSQELQKKDQEAKHQVAETQLKTAQYNSDLEQKMATLKSQQQQLIEKDSTYQLISEKHRKLAYSLNLFEVQDIESQEQEKRLEREIQGSREWQEMIKNKELDFTKVLEEVEKKISQISAEASEYEQKVKAKKVAIDEFDSKILFNREELHKIEEKKHQLEIQHTQLEGNINTLKQELEERYHLTIDELKAAQLVLEKSVEQSERELRSLRRSLEEAGDINMTSIEEYDALKQRFEFLKTQIQDLEISKEEIVRIITQLDDESRKMFSETFEIIRKNFQKNFAILFGGGESDLQFTESTDILQAGVDIIAKPPGKQMRSIYLMSGGEKCLTALALLFAIFEVKPAPFCILDEIDAPLDDTNVERFLQVVKQFINRCQFIIITHNKRTMAMADVLFGVSMEERGVSKVLSLSFAGKDTNVNANINDH